MPRPKQKNRGAANVTGREEDQQDDEKENEESEEEEKEDNGALTSMGEAVSREPTVSDLAGMLQAIMGQQQRRDAQRERERAQQEDRFKALQQQFQLLQEEVQARSTPDLEQPQPAEVETTPTSAYSASPPEDHVLTGQSRMLHEPRLEKLTTEDDIEHYLITFERIAAVCRWHHRDWVFRLIPLLTGKARAAYVHMDMDEALDYEKVKLAILQKYDINAETYRQRFRSLDVDPGESPKELYVRLKELYGKWIQPKNKTVTDVSELIILEQYLRMLSPELQVWIKEHDPKTATEAATLAEVFVAARKKNQPWTNAAWKTRQEARKPPPQHLQRAAPGIGKTYAKEELEAKPGKSRKPRSQKRQDKFSKPLSRHQLFSRVGFPSEIVTDQGTNFMSELLKQVYKLLGIRSVRTTPYHPQTDGLTERFNQTFKQMLRKFVNDTGSDWDQWLPYLLFAYREVPQASSGFSPFELLYGHDVRGPLTLLKEVWEGDSGGGEPINVVSYVIQMREKLQKMSELAQDNMKAAQRGQKTWYDRAARHRSLEPGDKVLVMLPTSDSKLLAKWQGPFDITRKMGPTTYEVSLPGRQRSKRILHVNLLKEWVPRGEKAMEAMLIQRVDEEEEVDDQYMPGIATSNLNIGHLTEQQQSQPSKSEWCNPVVLVPKKDGTIRFCIDFRYLNSISKFDSYPTPRVDELIERLGKAKYLTTIDLCKGYWQVPLSEQSREFTAFRTPWGLFEFTVLPFGLHGAPATFQRLMDQVLCGHSEYACAYLDDIVVFSTTWEDHMEHLANILNALQAAGLTINPAKCSLAQTETQYLGLASSLEEAVEVFSRNGWILPSVHT
ncbi:hypothetical protein WMY93_013610 [Mugilogobius chulae]|uniref:ribonuclease H n=1 Tax=Mugilogobius chulae TaxID=88201 RepID=A0AAW0P3X4_9GOBI